MGHERTQSRKAGVRDVPKSAADAMMLMMTIESMKIEEGVDRRPEA